MGSGSWTTSSFASYTTASKRMSLDDYATSTSLNTQDIYKSRRLDDALNPLNIMRECCDSDEHPHTIPVILALDVTGSMGSAATKVAQKLNEIMTDLYADDGVKDIEFCVMGIGDLAYDNAPIQMSQFESDVRIAEQLDKVYFEFGGGGNSYESYTAAWYMGVNHCKLDCWNRGEKGIIITLGDELPNPYLPVEIGDITIGRKLQGDVETKNLLEETLKKFDVYHISVDNPHSSYSYNNRRYDLDGEWTKLLGEDHYHVANLDNLAAIIVDIIKVHTTNIVTHSDDNEVSW